MKIGIIHLSDMHFMVTSNHGEDIANAIALSVRDTLVGVEKVFIAITGDIAFSGKHEEYSIALDFVTRIISDLKTSSTIETIIVPGNHDCNFEHNNAARTGLLKGVKGPESVLDSSVIDICCGVQKEYFDFEALLINKANIVYDSKLLKIHEFLLGGRSVSFFCYNTSWMSNKKELYGGVSFPVEILDEDILRPSGKIVVSLMHHPFHWYGEEDNRRISKLVDSYSNVVMTGHEHSASAVLRTDFNTLSSLRYEGGRLYDGITWTDSKFMVAIFDLANERHKTFEFVLNGKEYVCKNAEAMWVEEKKIIGFNREQNQVAPTLDSFLSDLGINIQHPRCEEVKIEDIFVYPYLREEKTNADSKRLRVGTSSKEILFVDQESFRFILTGGEKVGKTTLCKAVFRFTHSAGFIPVFVEGNEIRSPDINDFIKLLNKKYDSQYINRFVSFSGVTDKRRLIIIDNFDKCRLNYKHKAEFLSELKIYFNNFCLTIDEASKIEFFAIEEEVKDIFVDIRTYSIRNFGHILRDELINKWNLLGQEFEIEATDLYKKNDHARSIIDNVMGKNLVPAYPIFILTILQSIELGNPHNLKTSSQGYYYDYLIIQSLGRLKKGNDEIDAFYNYVTELAYRLYTENISSLSDEEMRLYHAWYGKKYEIAIDYNDYILTLVESRILDHFSQYFSFKYKYIYYFFVARYLSHNIHEDHIRDDISEKCKKLHNENNANIIMFLTHHNKDPFIITELVQNSKKIFAEITPITLEKDISFINGLIDVMPSLVLEDKQVKESRLKALQSQDQRDASAESAEDSSSTQPDLEDDKDVDHIGLFSKVNFAFKSIEILGQIVKNNYGSLPANRKQAAVEEAFAVGLRTLHSFISFISNNCETLVEAIKQNVEHKGKATKADIDKISKEILFELISGMTSGFIKKISRSVGSDKLTMTFANILSENDHPSFHLIDTSIKLDYKVGLPMDKIKNLEAKLSGNAVAYRVLQQLVLDYIYMFPTSEQDKQRICKLLDISMSTQRLIVRASRNMSG